MRRRACNTLECLAVGYLLFPSLLFFGGWCRWPFAVAFVGLGLCVMGRMVRASRPGPRRLTPRVLLLVAAVALAWVALGGVVGPCFPNDDWKVRMSVLRDLAVGRWPVSYLVDDGPEHALRLPLAYYLPAAGLAGAFSGAESAARVALMLWTSLGVGLFLALLVAACGRGGSLVGAVMPLGVAIAFSGMDLVGIVATRLAWPGHADHLEWWAWPFQYSSMTTQMFWVPNHALPGWIAGTVLWRHRRRGLDATAAAPLFLSVILWSPLVALGVAPLIAVAVLRGRRLLNGVRQLVRPEVAACGVLAAVEASFLLGGLPANEAGRMVLRGAFGDHGISYFTFSLLEWGMLAWVVFRSGERGPLFAVSVSLLALLPMLRFGPGNDVVTRASIPALVVLLCATIRLLSRSDTASRTGRGLVWTMLAIGSVTAYHEVSRAFVPRDRFPTGGRNFVQINGTPWHYVAARDDGWRRILFADPVPLRPGE